MVRVKICGVNSIAEMQLAQNAGADAIGVLVGQIHKAADFVEPEIAAEICHKIGPFVTSVLVTHVEDPAEIIALAHQVSSTAIQIHSDLSAITIRSLRPALGPVRIIGKVSVEGEDALERARELDGIVDAILVDSIDRKTDRVGGTGLTHDWNISARIVRQSKVPVILAGGLTPTNVSQAIMQVRPWAVDVNSGVEDIEKRKSEILVTDFIDAAKANG